MVMTTDGLESGNIHLLLLTLINGTPAVPAFAGERSKMEGGKCKGCVWLVNSSHDPF